MSSERVSVGMISPKFEIIVISCRLWAEISTCEIDLDVNSCS